MSKKLVYYFNVADFLEVENASNGDWVQVTCFTFRSYAGNRRTNGEEYVGPYHVHVTRPMVGAFHSSKPHDDLIPMNATIFGPGEMTEEEKIINTDAKTYNSLL